MVSCEIPYIFKTRNMNCLIRMWIVYSDSICWTPEKFAVFYISLEMFALRGAEFQKWVMIVCLANKIFLLLKPGSY